MTSDVDESAAVVREEKPPNPIVCLLSSVRNAGKHLREWFDYHRRIGVDRFYVIDHRPSEDDTSAILEEQPDAVVICKRGPFDESRWSAELCNTAFRDGAQALFPNDTDEFLCGNGMPFRQAVDSVFERMEQQGLPALHYLSPGFNMFPTRYTGDDEDWRTHVLARPNPLFTGKSAVFVAQKRTHVVIQGCQHRLRLRPALAATVRPDALPEDALALRPDDFPFYYLHFPFHGPTCFLRRVHTFLEGPRDKVWQMATRYGEGLVDEPRRTAGDLTDEDLATFVARLLNCSGSELYRKAVLDGGLPRACGVRTDLADFYGLDVPRKWTPELLEESLRSFGGLERSGAGPFTEAEFVLWPVGAVQLKKLEEEQRQRLLAA